MDARGGARWEWEVQQDPGAGPRGRPDRREVVRSPPRSPLPGGVPKMRHLVLYKLAGFSTRTSFPVEQNPHVKHVVTFFKKWRKMTIFGRFLVEKCQKMLVGCRKTPKNALFSRPDQRPQNPPLPGGARGRPPPARARTQFPRPDHPYSDDKWEK